MITAIVANYILKKKTAKAEQWVTEHADYLYAFALKRLPDPEQCKDLVQDTFMSAIKSLYKFEGNSSERTWLTSILKHRAGELGKRKEE